MANKNTHNFTSKELSRAWGSSLLILTLLFLVSPLGILFPIGGWIFLVFGNIGFYFLNAFLLLTSVIIIAKGSLIKGYFSWVQILGFAIFMLGLSALTSTASFHGKELSDVSSTIMSNWDVNNAAYYVNPAIGGGYLGFAIYSLLAMIGTDALAWVLSVALIVLGVVFGFIEEIKSLISVIYAKATHSRAINNSKKAAKRTEKQMSDIPSYDNSDLEMPRSPFQSNPSYQPATTETRVDRYGEDAPEISTPAPRYTPSNQNVMLSSGLHEAHFGEELTVEDSISSPTPATYSFEEPSTFDEFPPIEEPVVEEEPAPAPVEPAPIPGMVEDPLAEEPVMVTPGFVHIEEPVEEPAPVVEEPAPMPTYQQPAPSYQQPAPMRQEPAPAYVEPAPAPAPAPEVIIEEVEKVPAFQNPRAVDPEVTKAEKFQALLSTFDPEKRIIIEQLHADMYEELPPYTLPTKDLLNEPAPGSDPESIIAGCEAKKALIDQLFVDFKVGAHVESYVVGPSITRFNIAKDSNVRVSAIASAISDLSIRLSGTPARFQEVIMGQSTSGLEIPNEKSVMVTFKEMINSIPEGDKYRFHIPFGKDVTGKYVTGDIRKFPHMLIAGSTGSGKSIFIHSILMSLIMKSRPEELKLILVDPKRVEMALYKDLPHLLCPIIKDVTQVKVCLDKLIVEMERRNTIFEHASVTNIEQYNTIYAPQENMAKLPYIVLVLDEFADAVDVCKNISEPVARLAQKARSAGIHIILTTQRPTVDVVNGRIKANLPTTVALWVRTATDSTVILGEGGAENLAGHGDMLINCPEINKYSLIRAQGCYVDPQEIIRVCNHIRQQQKTHYDPVFLDLVDHEAEQKAFEAAAAAAAPSKSEIRAGEAANKYDLIKEDVMNMEYVSISKIQREYGVGFPRAGKIIKQLQDEGIVATQEPGQETNSKGLKVLIHSPSQLSGSNDGTSEGVKTIPAGWDMPK